MNDALPVLPEDVLHPLCQPFRKAADSLLDLYGMTQNPSSPSQCVQCFFRLLQVAEPSAKPALQPLKTWIESNIEISIQTGSHPSGSLPVQLDQPDLERFCQEAIERVRLDTVMPDNNIELTFRYKSQAA